MKNDLDKGLLTKKIPQAMGGTLVLAFSGWMDGGDVSTGTVRHLVDLIDAEEFAEIDPERYYIYSFPGSMEVAALFRPQIVIKDGVIESIDMPNNRFYFQSKGDIVFFIGKEPNLNWRDFGDCIFQIAESTGVKRVLFVGSFGGPVPHTREPRLYITCSDKKLLPEMERYGMRRTGYEGPGSFTSYLMSRAKSSGLEMTSLVAEIPGYLQGTNPMSIEAVTRRLATILKLPVDLDSLRTESTEWEMGVSTAVEDNTELAEQVRLMEEAYDNELLEQESNADEQDG